MSVGRFGDAPDTWQALDDAELARAAIDDWLFGKLLPYCVAHFDAIDDGEFDLASHFAGATAALCASGYAA